MTQLRDDLQALLREGFLKAVREVVGDRPLYVELQIRIDDGYPTDPNRENPNGSRLRFSTQARSNDGRRILSGYGDSIDEAVAGLRKDMEEEAKLPERAAAVADLLRDIPEMGFDREHVLMEARNILDRERQQERSAPKGRIVTLTEDGTS